MPTIASSRATTAIGAVFTAQAATSPQGPLIQVESDIATAAAAGEFQITDAVMGPDDAVVLQALGFTTKMTGDTWTVSWLRPTR